MRLSIYSEFNMKKGIKLSFMFENKGISMTGTSPGSTFEVANWERYGHAYGSNMYCDDYAGRLKKCTGSIERLATYKGTSETESTEGVLMENLDVSIKTLQAYYSYGDKHGTKLMMNGDDTIMVRPEARHYSTLYGYEGSDYFTGPAKKFIGGPGNDSFELYADLDLWQNDVIVNGGDGRDTYILNFEEGLNRFGTMRIKDFEKGVEKLYIVEDYDSWKGDNYKNLKLVEKNGNTKLRYKDDRYKSTLAVFEDVTGLDMSIKKNLPIGDVGLSGWHADHVAGLDSQATIF